jgi:UDP-N-acetyl-D-glucosamine dehydrogenase
LNSTTLLEKINNKNVTIGIVGLGYVGLPLAVTFASAGIHVIGFEKDKLKVENVNKCQNYIADVDEKELQKCVSSNLLSATLDFKNIKRCDAVIICVPTPLDKFKKPNMAFIEESCTLVGQNIKEETFICMESTTYPTTTEDFILPIIEKESGLRAEEDFWLAFSPERVDPGNIEYKTRNTPKVLGAISKAGQEIGMALYSMAISKVYPVSSPRVAEMVKILENTYRLVNISLINELALLSHRMHINIWEVIDAAATKPYGFQPFYPGPGIGGHCIPLDPFYLEHIAKGFNFDLTMISTAGQIDNLMPSRMMVRINFALNKQKKALNGSQILFLGVAYKSDIADERESPALKIIDEVIRKGGIVSYHDPYIPQITTQKGHSLDSVILNDTIIANADCVVITTKHSCFDFDNILTQAKLIVDLRNAYPFSDSKIFKL